MHEQGESVDSSGSSQARSAPESSRELADLLEERVRALVERSSRRGSDAQELERKLEARELQVAELSKELKAMSELRARVLKQVEGLIKQVRRLESKSGEQG